METKRPPRFWELARRVVAEAQRLGLVVPGFRSPPRLPGATRTVCRHPGGALVAVAWRGRSAAAVLSDMVDGVVLVNRLTGPDGDACRQRLWAGLSPAGDGGPAPPDVALAAASLAASAGAGAGAESA